MSARLLFVKKLKKLSTKDFEDIYLKIFQSEFQVNFLGLKL